jgi:hypothetical protein
MNLMSRFLLGGLILYFSSVSLGALTIPTGLSDNDQETVLQTIGFATAFRPIDSLYPLGLYSGVELGISMEDIPTGDLGYLGTGASVEKSVVYPKFSLGKGIFDNLDLFFSFAPYTQGISLGVYSGALRWAFYRATFVPATFSILLSGSSTNLDNLFFAQTEEADIITGVNADPFSFYIGAGTLYGQGQFDQNLTVENAATNQVARAFHTLLGATLTISQFFAAVELDNYATTTFSFKLGLRL